MKAVKHGDFTALARHYRFRPGYSDQVLRALMGVTGALRDGFTVADVGAGTGKLTSQLHALGLRGVAVEPNAAMRREAERTSDLHRGFRWQAGSAERTGLAPHSVDWVLMGSSFHWADPGRALAEFHRILKPGGFFTAVWNPRDIERSATDLRIEAQIREIVPELKRVSSGASQAGLDETLISTGHFGRLLFTEARHVERMSRSRYLGVWRSVNDVQVQAGAKRFAQILRRIASETKGASDVEVTYRTRAWTVQAL